MQTILGAGGAISDHLARALKQYTDRIRLVSRHPQKVNDTDTLRAADLTDRNAVMNAVEGSKIVYVTIGFPYNLKIWRKHWPAFASHVTEACMKYQAKLVFFDNIYMYDPDHLNGMTEETPINPPSEKGKIRQHVAETIMDLVRQGALTALIARAADFYGPSIRNNSILTETVFNPLSKGQKANWMTSAQYKHSYTYTPDAGKATALLGNTEDAYGQVWHLPTAPSPPTGREWVNAVARALGVNPSYREVPLWMIKLMGWFSPTMREMPEMIYQYDRDYVFDSSKFEQRFGIQATPYEEGIREIVARDYRK